VISFSIQNIRRSWKTSIAGVVLMLSGLMSVFLDKGTWAEISPLLLLSVYLLGSEDPKKPLK